MKIVNIYPHDTTEEDLQRLAFEASNLLTNMLKANIDYAKIQNVSNGVCCE